MNNVFIKSINKYLTKKNFFSIVLEIDRVYKNRNSLNLYKLDDLHNDLHNIRRFLACNVCKLNLSYSKHYYISLKHMEEEIIKLCFKKVNL